MQEHCNNISKIEIPKRWYNILVDLPEPLPPPQDPPGISYSKIDAINKIRPYELNMQDVSSSKWIDIPDDVLERYSAVGRPTQLMRASILENFLQTPAKIYIKREDVLPTHSFKLNSAIAQAYYAKKEGYKGFVTETGAGQWGLGLSYASLFYGLQNHIFWVSISRKQKPYRAEWCKLLGAVIYDSPSMITETGRKILEQNSESHGSLGISIGEAIETAMKNRALAYSSGSNLPHVILHQTIIGLEAKEQFKLLGEKPDIFVACCGGGSNLGGFLGPFIFDDEFNRRGVRFIAAESTAAPRLTKGEYKYDHADPYGFTPLVKSFTLGKDFMPAPIHVGGLRQHNGSPVVGLLKYKNYLEAYSYSQEEAINAGRIFAKCYGIIPAPETCHAIKAVIDFALEAKKNKEEKVIAMCFSGNGILDLAAYEQIYRKSILECNHLDIEKEKIIS